MTDQPQTPEPGMPAPAGVAGSSPGTVSERAWTPPTDDAHGPADGPSSSVADRPEIVAGAAFAGGFVLAMILKRLAR